jgi:ssDNA-binding replication factor A large subunit
MENDGVFLVTQNAKVIAQLSLSETAFKHLLNIDLASFPWNECTLDRVGNSRAADMQIKDVDMNVRKINLKAKVVEKMATRRVYSRSGTFHSLSTATICDNTGSIKLPLWDAQTEMISVGDTVQIENERVGKFRGELQVSVGKNGKLEVI